MATSETKNIPYKLACQIDGQFRKEWVKIWQPSNDQAQKTADTRRLAEEFQQTSPSAQKYPLSQVFPTGPSEVEKCSFSQFFRLPRSADRRQSLSND